MKIMIEEDEVKYIWLIDDFDFSWSAVNGHSGGLLWVWDKSVFKLEKMFTFDRFLIFEGEWIWEALVASMVNLYAPCDVAAQVIVWNNFLSVKEVSNWILNIAGVYNVIRYS
ncbi:hypothetical protein V6N13_126812 [Hibiscus sabdariffa]